MPDTRNTNLICISCKMFYTCMYIVRVHICLPQIDHLNIKDFMQIPHLGKVCTTAAHWSDPGKSRNVDGHCDELLCRGAIHTPASFCWHDVRFSLIGTYYILQVY